MALVTCSKCKRVVSGIPERCIHCSWSLGVNYPRFRCGECGKSFGYGEDRESACPHCGAPARVPCAVCGTHVAMNELNCTPPREIQKRRFHSFTQDDRPLCRHHSILRCIYCGELTTCKAEVGGYWEGYCGCRGKR
jgi:hypothetical protein